MAPASRSIQTVSHARCKPPRKARHWQPLQPGGVAQPKFVPSACRDRKCGDRAFHASHWLLYGLMAALPVIGSTMLSSATDPVVLGQLHLPPSLPHSNLLHPMLRPLHTALARLLLVVIAGHFTGAPMEALILRGGVFESVAAWRRGNRP